MIRRRNRSHRKLGLVNRLLNTDAKFEIGSQLEFLGATELEPRILLDGAIDDPIDVSTIDVDQLSAREFAEVAAMSLDAKNGNELLFFADFEDVDVERGGFDFFQQVSGFTATQSPVEIQDNHDSVGPGSQGSQLLELDGLNGVQVEIDTSSSSHLTLYFDFSARPQVSEEQNAIDVWWDGKFVTTISDDGRQARSTNFREVSIDLPSTSDDTAILEFRSRSAGEVLGLGGLIDNVRVYRELGPLTLAAIEDQNVAPGEQLNLTAMLAGDEVVDGLTYSILSGPQGISIDPVTGEIEWFASQANIDVSDARNDQIVRGTEGLLFQAGFEDVAVATGEFDFFYQVSGFTATGAPVEVQDNHSSVGAASEGRQLLELDGINGILRNIETLGLDEFELVLDYSARPQVAEPGNKIEIWWDGQLIDTLSADGTRKKRTDFNTFRFALPSHSSDLTQLEFRSINPNPAVGLGGLLDNIKLYRTPVTEIDGEDGKYEVVVQVVDQKGRSDTESFNICIVDDAAQPPVFDPISTQTVDEGVLFDFELAATDPDSTSDQLVFAIVESPAGATINPNTGRIMWFPEEVDGPGEYEFVVTVTDETGLSDSATFSVMVNEVNVAPVIAAIEDQILAEQETINLTVAATDGDLPANMLVYSIGSGPTGATINPTTGEFNWSPTAAQTPGVYDVRVAVSDGKGGTDTETFQIRVGMVNVSPVLAAIEDQMIDENTTLSVQASAVDSDLPPQTITYSLAVAPTGATIDGESGIISWTPNESEGPGTYDFTVVATDSVGAMDEETFQVVVNEVNTPPDLVVPEEVTDGELTLDLRSTLSLDFDATDFDTPQNQLLFSLEEHVAGAQIDPDTGVFTFFPSIGMVGQTLDFNVIVRDSGSPRLSDSHHFTIEVISCPFDDDLTNWTVQESGGSASGMGHVEVADCMATLFEGDSFNTSLETSFIVQQNKAVQFSFSDLNFDTTDPAFINDAFEVALLGPDGQSLIDTFADGRDAFFNISEGLPVATGDGVQVDGNTVTVGLNGLAVGTTATLVFRLVNDDSDTATQVKLTDFQIVDSFAQAARNTAEAFALANTDDQTRSLASTSREADNALDLPVVVTGGEISGTQLGEPYIIARAPRGGTPAGSQMVLTGDAIAQGIQSTGQPNQITFVTVNGRPVDQLDPTGKFFAAVDVLPGNNEFIFEAADIAGQTTQALLTIVGTQNESEINFNQFADITQTIEGVYARTSFDELGKTLFVDLVAANKGTFPADGPLLVGVKNISDPSVSLLGFDGTTPDGMSYYDFTKYLTGESLGSGSQSETGTIEFFNPVEVQFDYDLVFLAQVNAPPEITSIPVVEAYYDDDYTYDVEATDPNDDVLAYALTIASPGMTIDSVTGIISWSPTINDYGLHDVAIEVTDGRGGKAQQRFTLNVTEAPPNRPPIIVSTPVTSAAIPADVSLVFPVDEMVLNGHAALAETQDGEVIRLTPSKRGQAGSAFSQTLRNASDFSAAFTFRISDSAGPNGLGGNPRGADGLAFIIQSVSNTVGGGGGGIGYGGIDKSVAVEFDTFHNPNLNQTFWDPSSNHVGININGIVQHNNEFVVTIEEPLDNDELWFVWVDYDGFELEVRLSQQNVRPDQPTLTRILDIPTIIDSQNAYFGFASGTGDTWSNHDLVEWRFNDEYAPIDNNGIGDFVIDWQTEAINVSNSIEPSLYPTIVVDQDGKLNVAYHEGPDRGNGWYENMIYASFEVDGTVRTAPVSIDAPGWNSFGSLVVDNDNRTVLALHTYNQTSSERVLLTTLDENGLASGFFQVTDTPSRLNTDLPHLAVGNAGEIFLVWQDEVNDPINGDANRRRDLFFQKLKFEGTGYVLDGDPIEFTTAEGTGFGNVGFVNNLGGIAVDQFNNVRVVWADWRDSTDPNQTEIYYEVLSSDGATVVDETRISTLDGTPATLPQIEIDSSGNAHILWIEKRELTNALVHAIVDTTGQVVSTRELFVGETDSVTTFSVTIDDFNQLHVLRSDATGEMNVINYHRFNQAGDLLVDNLQVSETDADVSFNPFYLAIAVTGKDTFTVVWHERSEDGLGQETSDVFFKSFTVRSTAVVTYRYEVQAIDPDDDNLVFGLNEGPLGMTINPNTGVVLWSPAQNQEGNHDVTLEVRDGNGGVTEQSFVVCVHQDLADQPRQVSTIFEGEFETRLVNDAPTITSVPRIHAIQGEAYSYDAVASDLNGDPIKWNLDSAPVGMTINADTGEILWTPTEEQLGAYLVVLTAYDSIGASTTQRFQVHVGCNNLAPAIVSVPPTAALTQRDYVYAVRARDVEGDPLSWSLESAPEGMTIDAVRGFIRWQPAVGQIGSHDVIINVSDGTSTAKQTYTVVVSSADDLIDPNDPSRGTKGNRAPLITSTPDFGATVEQLYQYQIEAIDLDGHDISYALVGTVPGGMTVDANGLLTWTPTSDDTGDVAVNVQVVDEFGAIASQGFILRVETNSAPTIESTPRTTVIEGRTYRYTVNAIDADGDELRYELVEGPDGMRIDGQIGHITWSTFDNPVPAGTTYDATVKVTDTFGYEATQSWQIEVVEDTVAPTVSITIISPEGVFYGDDAEFSIGLPYRVQVLARDNAIVTDVRLAIDGVDVSLDERGIAVINPTQSGQFELVATATDSAGLTGTDQATVVLLNEAPEIISEPPFFAAANEDFTYQVIATDVEEHGIVYSISNGPAGATIDPLSGELTIAAVDFAPGSYEFTVRATDEFGAFSQQSISFDAIDLSINHAPIFLTQPVTAIPAGLFYFYLPQTLDYNGDTVTYELLEGAGEFKEETGRLRFRAPFVTGALDFVIQADDGNGGITTQEFTVNVTPANRAPVFLSQPTVRVKAGELYAYAPVISDPNGDDFELYNREGPRERKPGDFFSSWSIDIGDDNVLRWQTDLDDVGSYYVRLGALDQWNEWGYQSFTLEVVEDLTSPLVEIVATPNPAEVGDVIDIQVIAEDDGTIEALTLTFDGQVVELDADGKGTITATQNGHFDLVAVATDDQGNSTERVVPLQVRDLSDMEAPVVSLTSPSRDAVITSFTDVVGSVTDDNLLYYSLSYAPLAGGTFVEFLRTDQTVENDVLGKFDPSTLANDTYVIRLYARDINGQDAFVDTVVDVMGELKLGNFTLSFSDMTIPIGGIPIIVGRTYDSLNANQQGEFGYGWRLEFRDVDLRTSVAKTGNEEIGLYRPFKDGSRVYLTLPGGKREGFTFEVERAGGLRGALGMHFGSFKPDAGVRTQLTVPKFELAFDSEANVYTWGSNQAYNPANSIFGGKYYATTEEGILFEIDGDTGDLERVIDTNANVITYSDEAIVSSSGQRVDFIRDAQGRIVRAIDPEGNAIEYAYDDQGDLLSVTDREGNVTQFNYDAPRPHYLSEIIDPLGRTGIRTEYDETGKLVRMFDVNGNMTQLIHDPDNFVEQIVDPLGNTTTYEYDERGNVLREIDALGGVTTTTYDIENNELSVTDALGNTTEMTYSETGDLVTTTDALGNVTTKTYNRIQPRISLGGFSFSGFVKPFSVETSTTDAAGNVSSMGYDSQGNLTSMTNPSGETNSFEFDATGAPISVSRAGTTPQTFKYDSAGNLIESVDAFGNKTLVTYDGNGEILTETIAQTLADGSVVTTMTESEYDMEGRIRFVRYFEDGVMLTENESRYNEVGQRVEQVDTLGRSTKYVYDERGLLVETIYPDATPGDDSDNPRTRTEYDVLGQSTARIDELGRRTEYVYDALGRLVTTIFPDATPDDPTDNPRTETVYDLAGRMIAQIDELGNRTETIYDAAGRAIFTVLPDDTPDDATDNPRFETVYDAAGRSVEQIDPLGNATKFEYENGRAVRTIFADGTVAENIYNDIGIVVATVDQNGIRTDYEYNDQGQLLAVISAEVVNPAAGLTERPRTEYEYDDRGNLLIQRDALGKETVYEYDSRNRRISTTLPMGQTSTTTYDFIGRTIDSTDFNGDVTTYRYDIRDRLASKDFADGTSVSTTYTAKGLVETVTDARGVTSYVYDERSRLTLQVNPDTTSLAYTYDATGNRTSLTVPSGTTEYTYDAKNRISSVTDPDGDATTYTYNALNLISTTFANGTTESRVHDALNRLTYLENSGPGGVINSFAYSLDGAGNRTSILEADGRRVDYSYDNLNRLTNEAITDSVNGDRTISYVYDIVGNRLERNDSVEGVTSYLYDPNDRLVTETTGAEVSDYVYDANGNTLTKSVNGTLAASYQWNFENRLVAADTDGDGTIDVTYEYDASGNRVSKTENGETTYFLVDSARQFPQVVEEYTDGGVIKVSYVYGRDLISQNRPAETGKSIYHIDGLGSTRALTDSTGVVTDRYNYDAFGRMLAQVGTTNNLYLFAGEQRDFALGLNYLRARYLNPATGRFVSRDPWPSDNGRPLTHNRYSYVENNAVNLIDPSGYVSLLDFVVYNTLAATALGIGGNYLSQNFGTVFSEFILFTAQFGSRFQAIQQSLYFGVTEETPTGKRFAVVGGFLGLGYSLSPGSSVSASLSATAGIAISPAVFIKSPFTTAAAFFGPSFLASAGAGFGVDYGVAGGNLGLSSAGFTGFGLSSSNFSLSFISGFSLPLEIVECSVDPGLCNALGAGVDAIQYLSQFEFVRDFLDAVDAY